MRRKVLKVVTVVLAMVGLVALALVIRAKWLLGRSYADVPFPPLVADRSESGVRRGEMLFHALCIECHGGPDGRARGKRLDEVPKFLGTFYSANLAHPERGVHKRSDAELARTLRFGVLPDGRMSALMNAFGKIGDADVAALLGYLRSNPPALAPGGDAQPPTELTLLGELIITVVGGLSLHPPLSGVRVPKKAPNVEYGRYMVEVLDCAACHTEGFSSDKMDHPRAFAGGFELTDPTGEPIWSKNITMDEATGIGRWSLDDFERALTRGVTPGGTLVRKPMPLYARLERTEVEAIHRFLQTIPKVRRSNVPGGHPLRKARPADSAEVLFVNVGCAACHGKAAPYRDRIRAALGKSDSEVATWILDPQALKPGSNMPSFDHAIDRRQAEELARYVKKIAAEGGG